MTSLAAAAGRYLREVGAEQAENTLRNKLVSLAEFVDVCEERGVARVWDLGRDDLAAYRLSLAANDRRASSNKTNMAYVSGLLSWCRRRRLLRLSTDDIRDELRPFKVERGMPDYLTPDSIQKTLRAAAADDLALSRRIALPLVAFFLLSGCRRAEGLNLRWDQVLLRPEPGVIRFRAGETKTRTAREVSLGVSPALWRLLAAWPQGGRYVWLGDEPVKAGFAESMRYRMIRNGSPIWKWTTLRHTTATFLSRAPGIFGGAAGLNSAIQLGHSVAVAQRHYCGRSALVIDPEHRTLEAAMGIESELETLL